MEPEWQGQDIDVKCIASNNIDGKTEIIAKNITIKVIGESCKMLNSRIFSNCRS